MIDNKTIKPGVYEMTNEEYHSSPGISSSAVNLFLKSPKHYYDRYLAADKEEIKETPAMIIGSAFHCYVLEPEKFHSEYIVAPFIADKRTTAGKREYEDFLLSAKGKKVLSQKDMETVLKMAQSVNEHDMASVIVKNARYEKSIYWIDECSGLLCKCRPDIWHDEVIADLKTTDDASKKSFMFSIKKYGYDIQAAMYLDGDASVTKVPHYDFVHIVVEKDRPYITQTYHLHDEDIKRSQNKYKETLLKMKECFDNNYWPAYHNGLEEITLPNYLHD